MERRFVLVTDTTQTIIAKRGQRRWDRAGHRDPPGHKPASRVEAQAVQRTAWLVQSSVQLPVQSRGTYGRCSSSRSQCSLLARRWAHPDDPQRTCTGPSERVGPDTPRRRGSSSSWRLHGRHTCAATQLSPGQRFCPSPSRVGSCRQVCALGVHLAGLSACPVGAYTAPDQDFYRGRWGTRTLGLSRVKAAL